MSRRISFPGRPIFIFLPEVAHRAVARVHVALEAGLARRHEGALDALEVGLVLVETSESLHFG